MLLRASVGMCLFRQCVCDGKRASVHTSEDKQIFGHEAQPLPGRLSSLLVAMTTARASASVKQIPAWTEPEGGSLELGKPRTRPCSPPVECCYTDLPEHLPH